MLVAVGLRVVLVLDFAAQLLDDILDGDEPGGAAVLIDHDAALESWGRALEENDTHVELRSGLASGQRYAATGSFTLKAQLEKSGFASGHNH